MKLTQKLVGYLNRVFARGPAQELALRVSYESGAMRWSVADGELVLTVTGGVGQSTTIPLGGHSVQSLAALIASLPGFSVPFVAGGEIASRSAMVLLDGSGDQSASNGDHLYGFTSALWAYLHGQAVELTAARAAIGEALLQMAANTASESWVDEHGSYYGIPRRSGEADAAYAARMVAEISVARGNNFAISSALRRATEATSVTVVDYGVQTTAANGTKSYGLFDVDVDVPLDSTLQHDQIVENAGEILVAMRDAGTHIRNLRFIRTTRGTLFIGSVSVSGHSVALDPRLALPPGGGGGGGDGMPPPQPPIPPGWEPLPPTAPDGAIIFAPSFSGGALFTVSSNWPADYSAAIPAHSFSDERAWSATSTSGGSVPDGVHAEFVISRVSDEGHSGFSEQISYVGMTLVDGGFQYDVGFHIYNNPASGSAHVRFVGNFVYNLPQGVFAETFQPHSISLRWRNAAEVGSVLDFYLDGALSFSHVLSVVNQIPLSYSSISVIFSNFEPFDGVTGPFPWSISSLLVKQAAESYALAMESSAASDSSSAEVTPASTSSQEGLIVLAHFDNSLANSGIGGAIITDPGTVYSATAKFGAAALGGIEQATHTSTFDLTGGWTYDAQWMFGDGWLAGRIDLSDGGVIRLLYDPLFGDFTYQREDALGDVVSSLAGSSAGPVAGSYVHVEFTNDGTTTRGFINGDLRFSGPDSMAQNGTLLTVSGNDPGSPVDEWRFVAGSAMHVANFTPPTSAYTGAETPAGPSAPPAPSDPSFSSVLLLVHGDAGYADSSPAGRTPTAFGSPPISSTAKFGAGSIEFSNDARRLSYPTAGVESNLGSIFTVEAWVRFAAADSNTPAVVGSFHPVTGGWVLRAAPSGISFLATLSSGGTDVRVQNATARALNTWYHVAVTRNGSVWRLFVNGILFATQSNASDMVGASGQPIEVGNTEVYGQAFSGLIDDVRVTKGVARYTADFTPPAEPFPDQ